MRAIIGAVLIDGNGGPPITDSVVSRIRAAGLRANVPIPAEADKINGSGKFLVPGLIDVYVRSESRGPGVTTARIVRPGVELPGDMKILELASQRASFLFIRTDASPSAADSILDESRKYNIPVTAGVATLAQAQQLVKSGAAGFVGMIGDTEDIDQAFLAKIRALKVVFAPGLTLRNSETARRNTKRMAVAGVPIAVGSGGDSHRELELLIEAGMSPLEVNTAATRNGAVGLQKLDELGTIEAGKRADLLLLNANPLEDVRNFRNIDRVMREGDWVK